MKQKTRIARESAGRESLGQATTGRDAANFLRRQRKAMWVFPQFFCWFDMGHNGETGRSGRKLMARYEITFVESLD